MKPILIGTGFYASKANYAEKCAFASVWFQNTAVAKPKEMVVLDSNESFATNAIGNYYGVPYRYIPIRANLGYTGDAKTSNRIMGWSMSWILPALVAYSENCDYIYKEQDCLAFGDWVPIVRGDGKGFRCGRYSRMDAEQSLFFLERDFIPDFVAAYLSIKQTDLEMLPESKGPAAAKLCGITDCFFDMPFGRERPLTIYTDRPWYAQRFTPDELRQIREVGLL